VVKNKLYSMEWREMRSFQHQVHNKPGEWNTLKRNAINGVSILPCSSCSNTRVMALKALLFELDQSLLEAKGFWPVSMACYNYHPSGRQWMPNVSSVKWTPDRTYPSLFVITFRSLIWKPALKRTHRHAWYQVWRSWNTCSECVCLCVCAWAWVIYTAHRGHRKESRGRQEWPVCYFYPTERRMSIAQLLHAAGYFLRSWKVLSWSRNVLHFMEPERSLPHSQAPDTCSYPEPDQSIPWLPFS
jgi:hypothetical protein